MSSPPWIEVIKLGRRSGHCSGQSFLAILAIVRATCLAIGTCGSPTEDNNEALNELFSSSTRPPFRRFRHQRVTQFFKQTAASQRGFVPTDWSITTACSDEG